jgi:hypothetical protein
VLAQVAFAVKIANRILVSCQRKEFEQRGEKVGKRKARFGYPPGSLKARFFQSHSAWSRLVNFPPEIQSNYVRLGFLG